MTPLTYVTRRPMFYSGANRYDFYISGSQRHADRVRQRPDQHHNPPRRNGGGEADRFLIFPPLFFSPLVKR